jgi:hypothetical protein
METEFFVCPCPGRGYVILDDNSQGSNKNDALTLFTKQCNTGLHSVSLACQVGRVCRVVKVEIQIEDTDPIEPMEVPFECA